VEILYPQKELDADFENILTIQEIRQLKLDGIQIGFSS
tara:strand:- start:4774 stop:4887 length:114 start_codon:yes stop_codon:yes gene_type:complete